MTGRRFGWCLLLAVPLLLGGCAGGGRATSPGGTTTPGSAGPASGAPDNPEQLIGLWHLDAPGEEAGAVLRIGLDLSVWRRCNEEWGGWAADRDGTFVADLSGYSYACAGPKPTAPPKPDVPAPPPPPAWLVQARGWRVEGPQRTLVDADGAVVARLTPGASIAPRPDVAPQQWAPPQIDAELRQRLRAAAPLPVALRPATRASIVGTWRPEPTGGATLPPSPPFVAFKVDGTWRGSDGCNEQSGRWNLGSGGALLLISGGSTLIGCGGQEAAPRINEARRLGFADAVLVLVSVDGTSIGRLMKTG